MIGCGRGNGAGRCVPCNPVHQPFWLSRKERNSLADHNGRRRGLPTVGSAEKGGECDSGLPAAGRGGQGGGERSPGKAGYLASRSHRGGSGGTPGNPWSERGGSRDPARVAVEADARVEKPARNPSGRSGRGLLCHRGCAGGNGDVSYGSAWRAAEVHPGKPCRHRGGEAQGNDQGDGNGGP